MILGSVNANREAIIQIAILGDRKQVKSIRPVIDTGNTFFKLLIKLQNIS